MTAPAFGVIPQHPAAKPLCDNQYDDLTGIFCQRDAGHPGDHEGVTWVTWPQDGTADDTP